MPDKNKNFLAYLMISLQIIIVILLLFMLSPCHAQDLHEETSVVFFIEEDGSYKHIAWYYPNAYVKTNIQGKDIWLQELFVGSHLITQSLDSEIHDTYFVHFYPRFKIYSTEDKQSIVYSKDFQCLDTKQDMKKSSTTYE